MNHRTLLPAEVPIFRELGYEVFIPKIIPDHPSYRSGVVTFEYDASLTIPSSALAVLNKHEFYGGLRRYRAWGPTLQGILNEHFDVVVSSLSAFISPLSEAIRHFDGLVLARVFGLTHPDRYIELLEWLGRAGLVDEMAARGSRYAFVQGYPNLAEIEPPGLAANAHTVTVPLPESYFRKRNSWVGGGRSAIFVCPGILKEGFYRNTYNQIKRDFGDIPHVIFGKQSESIDDPAVLPFLTDEELIELYARAPVFIYPSTEARHIHYSPIEAMVVGTPVLVRRGSLSDILAGNATLPGVCGSTEEIVVKARRLLNGDRQLAKDISAGQNRIVDAFQMDVARRQWAAILAPAPQRNPNIVPREKA